MVPCPVGGEDPLEDPLMEGEDGWTTAVKVVVGTDGGDAEAGDGDGGVGVGCWATVIGEIRNGTPEGELIVVWVRDPGGGELDPNE
jgi:hypothetical protein